MSATSTTQINQKGVHIRRVSMCAPALNVRVEDITNRKMPVSNHLIIHNAIHIRNVRATIRSDYFPKHDSKLFCSPRKSEND